MEDGGPQADHQRSTFCYQGLHLPREHEIEVQCLLLIQEIAAEILWQNH